MSIDQESRHDPEREFGEPRKVLEDASLTAEQKLEILESWRADLIELQVAEEENMPSSDADQGAAAARLTEVSKAIATIRGEG
jgi:hypothetical protein